MSDIEREIADSSAEFVSANLSDDGAGSVRSPLSQQAPQGSSLRIAHEDPHLLVVDYVCRAGPHARLFEEVHERHSLSLVRRGAFGCRSMGEHYELAPGGFLIGAPGDSYVCTHEHHHAGDECLSFQFAPELVDEIGADDAIWRRVFLPPATELAAVGALAQATAEGETGLSIEEAGLRLAARFVDAARGQARSRARPSRGEARRAIEVALWMDANAGERIHLADAAREAALSSFYFLRVFANVLGTTPNRYLIACRLRRAADLLTRTDSAVTDIALDVGFDDLSNFQRTFKKAAGVTPGQFRKLSKSDRKILQARLASAALG
jgi:AraC-like DNA-binding protein